MTTYGLWYFKARGGFPEEFPNAGTPSTLKSLGFGYAVALYSSAKDESGDLLYGGVPYSGITYEDGYNDALKFAGWIDSKLRGIDYLVFIPVLADDYSFDFGSRTTQYLKGWVDGIYNNTSNYQKGFYWYLEFPWQVAKNIVYEETISEISNHIRNKGQQFIWIPNVNDRINLNNTDIKLLSKYFTHVFVQPHYYQRWRDYYTGNLREPPERYPYLSEDGLKVLTGILDWIREIPNGYIEMEVDGTINSYPELIDKACDYVTAQKNSVVGDVWPYRAYYYDINLENIKSVRRQCPEW